MAERNTRPNVLGASVALALSLHALAFWGMDVLSFGQHSSGPQAAGRIVQLRLLQGAAARSERQEAETDAAVVPALGGTQTSETSSQRGDGRKLASDQQAEAETENLNSAKKAEPQAETPAGGASLAESGLEIEHPDSPLPGGHARVQVTMSLDRRGQIDAIRLEPGALPDAFVEALRSAFVGRMGSGNGLGLRPDQGSSLCVEVEFSEGEPPRWRVQGTPSSAHAPY